MASKQTPNIGLNKWVPTDYVKMDEFNENFDKIDEKFGDTTAQLAERPNLIDVTNFGVKNDGTPIGGELNLLINSSFGKTLYFPDGTYNLTEPMITPWDYGKQVHLTFSPNAIIKSDQPLTSLLKIGFSEINTSFDRSQRRFNYITGGQFDCSNVGCGIEVNGLKQLVFLKDINLYKGKKHHIKINVTDDFNGTGSADTKIQNVHIQGLSSNEDSYGIYIDNQCNDCELSNIFIYGCKTNIYTKSGGHFISNVHMLSQITTGGLDLGDNNFKETIGIDIHSSSTFHFESLYFDTIDVCVNVSTFTPKIVMLNSFFYSYLNDFGSCFYKRDRSINDTVELYMANCSIDIRKDNYRIVDANAPIGYDPFNRLQIVNLILNGRDKIFKFDPYLSQKVRNVRDDYLIQTNNMEFKGGEWVVLGVLPPSAGERKFYFSYSYNRSITLYFGFTLDSVTYEIHDPNNHFAFHLGRAKIEVDGVAYDVLLFYPNEDSSGFPVMTTLSGMNCFMRTPTDAKKYFPSDYGISEDAIEIIVYKS